ncbi:S-layer homology domain-containing protein, partial [Patescibacteria group bacterium]|nr:S-layer homology domain-containing protein [Patescibacteria group bacterium]
MNPYTITTKNMRNKAIIAAVLLVFGQPALAFASPVFTAYDNQTFSQNATYQQLVTITVTEDQDGGYIKAGSIKLHIPDELAMIFETENTSKDVVLSGTAVTNGRTEQKPAVTFENKDKTLAIPVVEDFASGESMTINSVYVEGFHASPGQSYSLYFTVNDGTEKYFSNKYVYIQPSNYEDTNVPDKPTNIAVSDTTGGVKLSWTDPTDLDLQQIHILRGLNNLPVDAGNPIVAVAGVQEYTDTNVNEGDTVKYILRASDGKNVSENTNEIQFVVGSGSTAPAEEPTEEMTPPAEEPTEEAAPAEETPAAEESQYCAGFTDIPAEDSHCAVITYVSDNGIFEGYDDGTFKADAVINRAEALKVIVEGLGLTLLEDDGTDLGFSDVQKGAWYMPYLKTAKEAGIIEGYPDGTFKPEQRVNYVEMMKMFLLAAGAQLPEVAVDAAWYQPYVHYAIANDLVEYQDLAAGMK